MGLPDRGVGRVASMVGGGVEGLVREPLFLPFYPFDTFPEERARARCFL